MLRAKGLVENLPKRPPEEFIILDWNVGLADEFIFFLLTKVLALLQFCEI